MSIEDLRNELVSNVITLQDLQKHINFAREEYDNWGDYNLAYEIPIDKSTNFSFNVGTITLVLDSESDDEFPLWLTLHPDFEKESINLKHLDDILNIIRENFPENWSSVAVSVTDFPNPIEERFEIINEITQEDLDDIASGHHGYPRSSYLDEEEKEYVFLL